jgi:uncharacterized membrane protein YczE
MDNYHIATDRFALRLTYFICSLFGAAYGITFIFKAGIGVDPANVLIDGLFNTFGISLGFWITSLWLFFVVSAFLMGLKPYIATVLDLVFFGVIVDALMIFNRVPLPEAFGAQGIWVSAIYMFVGLLILAFSVGVYINAQLGAGPTMLFTFALARKMRRSIGLVKTATDIVMLVIGFLLGGAVGAGTVVLALSLGYLFEFFIKKIRLPGLGARIIRQKV